MQPARPVRLRSAQVFFCLLEAGSYLFWVVLCEGGDGLGVRAGFESFRFWGGNMTPDAALRRLAIPEYCLRLRSTACGVILPLMR